MKVALTGVWGSSGRTVRYLISETGHQVLNIDSQTYAATEGSVSQVQWFPATTKRTDICDAELSAGCCRSSARTSSSIWPLRAT